MAALSFDDAIPPCQVKLRKWRFPGLHMHLLTCMHPGTHLQTREPAAGAAEKNDVWQEARGGGGTLTFHWWY